MRVLLTGARGFLGSFILRRLLDDGHAVAIVLRDADPSKNWRLLGCLDRASVFLGGIETLDRQGEALARFSPDTAIHCAWSGITRDERNDTKRQNENFTNTVAFADLCRRLGILHWIGIGSQAEHGPQQGPLNEDSPLDPDTPYGQAKLASYRAAEALFRRHGGRFAWLRMFSLYGPGDNPEFMIPSLIMRLLRRERPALSEGTQKWDYLHVADAAAATCHIARVRHLEGAYNVGAGEPRSIRSIAEDIRDAIDPSLPLGFGEHPSLPGSVRDLNVDPRRLLATNWQPKFFWHAGVRDTVDWYRKHLSNRI